ncbi:MAG: hypothetical protein L3J69_19185, partial [Desulfobacula sp.]|nr:hypothetical protein [Desulfobacula sp.]
MYLIEKVDFTNELEHHPYPWKYKGKSVSQYVDEVTKDRTYSIASDQWKNITAEIGSSEFFFVKSGNQKIQQFIPYFSQQLSKIYLRHGPENDFISIRLLSPGDYSYKKAPRSYQTPYYLWSSFLFLIGIFFYAFLPCYQFSDDTLHYGAGFRAVIGPDMIGLFFISLFFVLGLVVGLSGSSGGILSLFSSNLFLITCGLWSFTLFGFYIIKIGAKYAGLALT